jgi:hypothetical protein
MTSLRTDAAAAAPAHLAAALQPVSQAWKWYALLIALGVLVLIYVVQALFGGSWNPMKLVEGADKQPSTSKFQWFVWLVVILFAYVFLWVLRAREGNYGAITNVPANLLAVLGFSTATAVGAKGITVGYLRSGQISKPDPASANGGLLLDDSGVPELAKIQMIGFTFVAVGIFLVNVFHQARGLHPSAQLPNIDSSLLVLMGISQGGYIGKKLVSLSTPAIATIEPKVAKPGADVTISGSSFGGGGGTSRLLLDQNPIPTTSWTDTKIVFSVPSTYPSAGQAWTYPHVVRIGIDLGGGTNGNEVVLQVDAPTAHSDPAPGGDPAPW